MLTQIIKYNLSIVPMINDSKARKKKSACEES